MLVFHSWMAGAVTRCSSERCSSLKLQRGESEDRSAALLAHDLLRLAKARAVRAISAPCLSMTAFRSSGKVSHLARFITTISAGDRVAHRWRADLDPQRLSTGAPGIAIKSQP